MTPPTPAERAAWQAACEAATPGPWRNYTTYGVCSTGDFAKFIAGTAFSEDAFFIAIARTALPRLLAALTASENATDSWRDTCTLVRGANRNLSAENTRLRAELEEARHDAEYAQSRAETLQRERDAAQAEATKWRMEYQMMERTAAVIETRETALRMALIVSDGALQAARAQVAAMRPYVELLYDDERPAIQPPLPDPGAPEQLGLLEDVD